MGDVYSHEMFLAGRHSDNINLSVVDTDQNVCILNGDAWLSYKKK